MKIPVASDHAGFEAKEQVKQVLTKLGYTPVDLGTHSADSVDYPDYAVLVAQAIDSNQHEKGILVCGSGQGMCITANKFDNVRAALVYDEDTAALTRQHNDANILCLPGRTLHNELENIVKIWLNTKFEGGRHSRRINKIHDLTSKTDITKS
ncbi:MAG: ribose 5-phosphate isomerase B [Balneolales bacterium]